MLIKAFKRTGLDVLMICMGVSAALAQFHFSAEIFYNYVQAHDELNDTL